MTEDGELSHTDESKGEAKNIWVYCNLLWDLQQQGKERIDRIESLPRNRTGGEIGSDTLSINEFYPSIPFSMNRVHLYLKANTKREISLAFLHAYH